MIRVIVLILSLCSNAWASVQTPHLAVLAARNARINYTNDASCVGAWYMNGSSTTETDRSGDGNTLTETSGTIPRGTDIPSGYTGYSRDFEATADTEYLDGGDGNSLDISGTSNFSAVMWVKRESTGGQIIFGKWIESTNQRQYRVRFSSGNLFGLDISADGIAESASGFSTTAITTTGTWYHLAVVYNGTNIKTYLNASLNDTDTVSANFHTGTDTFKIGVSGDLAGYYDGLIDEVAIFTRELTSTEVSNIYTYGISGNKGGND